MAEMQTTKLNKSPSSSMFKAMKKALQPTENLLTTLVTVNQTSAEQRMETTRTEKEKKEEEKKQTGFLAGLFQQGKKTKEQGGFWGFLKNNWGKIALGIGLLLTPIKHLVAGFNWMKEYWENNTLAEMGADLATAFVVAMGLKIGAGVLFKKLSEVILKSLLPEGVELTAGALGRALLPAGSILAFVAGIGKSIWDGVEGWNFAKEWGVDKIDGAIGSFIGGTGKGLTGALTNALTKGGIGMGIGMMVGGPVGAIVGGVIGAAFGAITGWFGGERIAKWVNESRKEISKAWDNTTSILNDVMDKFKNWGNSIADDIISLVRKIPIFKDFGQTSEEKRRAAVGYDEAHLSTEEQNALQKKKHQQQDKALRGGAVSAVAKGDIAGIEAEIEAIDIKWSYENNEQEAAELMKQKAKFMKDKIAILDAQKNKKAKAGQGLADLKVELKNYGVGPSSAVSTPSKIRATPSIAKINPKQIGIDWKFISQKEGGSKLKGYVPDPKKSQSGVTIATGFDLGARSEKDIATLSPALQAKLIPYLGLKKENAIAALKARPLMITPDEAKEIDKLGKAQSLNSLQKEWNKYANKTGGKKFEELTSAQQTVAASVAFQYGSLSRTPRFRDAMQTGNWTGAINELKNFGDPYKSRRKSEALYLQASLTPTEKMQTFNTAQENLANAQVTRTGGSGSTTINQINKTETKRETLALAENPNASHNDSVYNDKI